MAEAYSDLLIRIYPYDERDGAYPVEAEVADGSRYTGGRLKLDLPALLPLQLNAEAYGMALFEALFAGDIRRAYDKATGAAEVQTGGRLRVQVWVDNEAVELHAIPWERLYHLHKGRPVPLGASALTPFSRYTSLEAREPAPIPDTPLRMLVAVANPANLPAGLAPANVDVEVDNLRRALSELKRAGKVEVTILPGHSGLTTSLRAKLEAEGYVVVDGVTNLFNIAPHLARCHIFHFIGHGAFRRQAERGEGLAVLYLEKADGAWQAVRDEEIVSMFTALGALPHLVFLVACESAMREAQAETPFVGLGPKLVRAGVPAVVAMQAQVPVELARLLAGEFYARLAEHGEVDRALNQARLQVFDTRRTEWAIPVLFMRLRRGRLFGADADEDAPAPGEPPYKGLEYFGEKDADKFYGRELLTAKLAGRLRLSRFLPIIIGASGSGKSSVVRAGLLPALARGEPLADGTLPPEGSPTWLTFTLTPGPRPLDALAAVLTREAESATATTTLIDDLAVDKRALHLHNLKLLGQRPEARRVLVVVDQFEEIFTLVKDESERRAFIDALLYASTEVGEGPTLVVIVFRADFYAYCAQYANLREAVATQQEFVGPMTRDELRRAIEAPAADHGWDLEPGLTELILKEVGDEPGALPLMQHALLETWKRRRGRTLTLRGYNDAGGIRGAIAKTADAIYQALPADQQTLARRIFLKLVELGEGAQDTRRRAALEELFPRAEARPAAEAVLKKLVDNRLIVTTDKTAEVAHEALIREWPAYREWVNANRAALKVHRELTRAANEWDSLLRSEAVLYRGVKLLEAVEWAEAYPGEMNALEGEFLQVSREAAEREAQEQEAQRQRELDQARQIAQEQSRAAAAAQQAAEAEKRRAEEQARAAVRQRFLTRVAAAVGAVAFVAAAVAVVLWGQANASSQRAELSAQAAREAQATAVANEQIALTKEQEAQAERTRAEAARAQAEAAQAEALEQARLAENRALIAAAYNTLEADPQASLILAREALAGAAPGAGQDQAKEVLYQAYETSRLTTILPLPASSTAIAYRDYGAEGGWLAIGLEGGDLLILDTAAETAAPRVFSGPANTWVTTLAFSPVEAKVLAGYGDGSAVLWDLNTNAAGLTVSHEAIVSQAAFEPLGRWFATTTYAGVLTLWDANTGAALTTLSRDDTFYDLVAIDSAGEYLAAASSFAGQAFVWQLSAGPLDPAQPALTLTFFDALSTLAFSPEGQLAVATADAEVTLWDLPAYFAARTAGQATAADLPRERRFFGHAAEVTAIDFSADGRWMATASLDWQTRVWDLAEGRGLYTLTGHAGAVYGVQFVEAPALKLATTGRDQTLRLWWADLAGGLSGIDYGTPLTSVAFAPNGRMAVGGQDGRIFIRDGNGRRELGQHALAVTGLAFNGANERLVSTSADGQTLVWEPTNATPRFILNHNPDFAIGVSALAVSADGRLIATGAADGTIQLWEANTGARGLALRTGDFPEAVEALALSADGAYLAAATDNGAVLIWDLAAGAVEAPRRTSGHFGSVQTVAFSLDGQRLASADDDGLIVIWDTASGEQVTVIAAHAGQITRVAFNASALISLGTDRAVRFWDLTTWKETQTLPSTTAIGRDFALSPEGDVLAVAGEDGVLRLYTLDDAQFADLVNRAVIRSLTSEECARYRLTGEICAQP